LILKQGSMRVNLTAQLPPHTHRWAGPLSATVWGMSVAAGIVVGIAYWIIEGNYHTKQHRTEYAQLFVFRTDLAKNVV
jgi:ABC-type ATPase with predicted acetyltransferase domain